MTVTVSGPDFIEAAACYPKTAVRQDLHVRRPRGLRHHHARRLTTTAVWNPVRINTHSSEESHHEHPHNNDHRYRRH